MNELPAYRDRTGRVLRQIERKTARKLRARRSSRNGFWLSLKLVGLIGWFVVVPVLLGIAAGAGLDARWPGGVSWTLTLLFGGLVVGCYGAWTWVERERSRIRASDKEGEVHGAESR